MQNISSSRKTSAGQSMSPPSDDEPQGTVAQGFESQSEKPDRTLLEREILEAMASFSPRDRGVLKNWHRHSISLVHLNVLTSLEAEGPLSMKRLADSMDISDASATGIVDRMEKRGLVERRHDTSDRRVVLVCPTDAGSLLVQEMDAHRRAFLARVLAELGDGELAALRKGMRAVFAARGKVLAAIAAANEDCPPATGDGVTARTAPTSAAEPAATVATVAATAAAATGATAAGEAPR